MECLFIFIDQLWHPAWGWKTSCTRASQETSQTWCWAYQEVRLISSELCSSPFVQDALQIFRMELSWNRLVGWTFGFHLHVRQQKLVRDGSESLRCVDNRYFCCCDHQRWENCRIHLENFLISAFSAVARRRRPSVNDDPFCIGPDVYSFPSGHASRASLLLGFFTCLHPFYFLFYPALFAWWFAICISRSILKETTT